MKNLNIDCLCLIFNQIDKNSLHSCLLVNREWCKIIAPILWNKYSWHGYNEELVFNTILSFLPSSSKQQLSDNGIKLPSTTLLKTPLFNYINFCEFPEAEITDKIIKMVFNEEFDPINPKKNLLEQEIYKLFVSQCKNIKELRWYTSQPLPLFPGTSTCFSQLCELYIIIDVVNSSALHEMAQICKDLNELTIYNCQDVPGLISLIDSQRKLKSVNIHPNNSGYHKKGIYKELEKALLRKSNTINSLRLYSISIIPPSCLTSFVNLKKISLCCHKYYDGKEEIDQFQQQLMISEFPNLEYLRTDGLSCFKELAMIIEKTSGNISTIDIGNFNNVDNADKNTGTLFKAIANNCPRINTLFMHLEPKDFVHIKPLLLNCRQLKCIAFNSFDTSAVGDVNKGDELLDILTKFSPNSLTDIYISEYWDYSIEALEQFFESCRKRTLCEFGFGSCCVTEGCITEEHEAIARKYVKEGVILRFKCGEEY